MAGAKRKRHCGPAVAARTRTVWPWIAYWLVQRRFVVPGDPYLESLLRRAGASLRTDAILLWQDLRARLPVRRRSQISQRLTAKELSLADALREQVRTTPCYLSSLALHLFVLSLLLLFCPVPPRPPAPATLVETDIVDRDGENDPNGPLEEVHPEAEIDAAAEEEEIEPIQVTVDLEIPDPGAALKDDLAKESGGGPGDLSTWEVPVDADLPLILGVGRAFAAAPPGRTSESVGFGTRVGEVRGQMLAHGGGGGDTENAVALALAWLAAHQHPDGYWLLLEAASCEAWARKFETLARRFEARGQGQAAQILRDRIDVLAERANFRVAITSFATLAFLGAGHTPAAGVHQDVVRRSVQWLQRQQDGYGCIGPHSYEAALALMAVSEAYGMTGDAGLRLTAEKAVAWAAQAQGSAGGWDYQPCSKRNDASVSGWWIMGLKSASTAGLDVPRTTWNRALAYLQAITDTGRGSPTYSCMAERASELESRDGGPRLSAVALCCLQFLGQSRGDAQVIGCARRVLRDGLPAAASEQVNRYSDFYRWYYATLGLYQLGAENREWQSWNVQMKKVLLATQVRVGTFAEQKGSWNELTDMYGQQWGRAGQTALGALMLEVYYRYQNPHEPQRRRRGAAPMLLPPAPAGEGPVASPKPVLPPESAREDKPYWGWDG